MSSWFVLNSKKEKPQFRLFCFHPAGGSASQFRAWEQHLPNEISTLALQLPGREDRFAESHFTDFASLIPILATEVTSYLDVPYAIVGHSLGALIGFELTRYFQGHKQRLPEFLIVAAKEPPHRHTIPLTSDINNDEWLIARLNSYNAVPKSFLYLKEFKDIFMPYIRSDFLLLSSYKYSKTPKLTVPIIALHGNEDKTVNFDKLNSWSDLTEASFEYKVFEGGHFFIRDSEAKVLEFLAPTFLDNLSFG